MVTRFPLGRQPRWGEEGEVKYYTLGSGGPGLFVDYFSGAATRNLPSLNRPPFRFLEVLLPLGLSCPGCLFAQPVNLGLWVFEV